MIKTIKNLLLLGVMLSVVSCSNMKTEFDDFGLTTVCFPYQTPARTLILGNYELGFNDNDNARCFEIGVTLSGLYKNEQDRYVTVEIDNDLLDGVTNVTALPAEYYEILTQNPVCIPAGDFKGRIKVRLNEDFFYDQKSIAVRNKVNYVIPIRITEVVGIDSVLVGTPAVALPHRVKAADWTVAPKDYTLFGIKFVNPYDGYFLRRGSDKVSDPAGSELGIINYRQKYVEDDELVRTRTQNLDVTVVPTKIRHLDRTFVDSQIRILFSEDNTCVVVDNAGEEIGTGEYISGGDEWGAKPRDVIHLQYSFKDNDLNQIHTVCDTLVMRDRDIVFEQFTPAF